jgi:hypothetical protein
MYLKREMYFMIEVPVTTTVGNLYPNFSKAAIKRKTWYLDRNNLRPRTQFRWTLEERTLLYDLRVVKGMSIPEIQRYLRRINKIPICLGPDDTDKFSRTRLHNQIRMAKGTINGLCYKCRALLTKKDLKRINRKDKEDPSLGLCQSCVEEISEYKKERREHALKEGLCPVCTKRKISKGHTTCRKCLSASHRHRYLKGLCGKCGEKPLAKNSISLCQDCLNDNKKTSRSYRRKKRLEDITIGATRAT